VKFPPARLPAFAGLTISVDSIAVGATHMVALTHHGRIFTWGELEACLGPEGFKRHSISQPVLVEGALKDLRIDSVAAGLTETAVSVHSANDVLGWELLEASPVGNKFLPALYHYSHSRHANVGRLSMPRNEWLQVLLAEEADTFPNPQQKPAPAKLAPANAKAKAKAGSATLPGMSRLQPPAMSENVSRILFQWAAKEDQHMPIGDPRTKALPLTAVTPQKLVKPHDMMDLDRQLGGYRRLAQLRPMEDLAATLAGGAAEAGGGAEGAGPASPGLRRRGAVRTSEWARRAV